MIQSATLARSLGPIFRASKAIAVPNPTQTGAIMYRTELHQSAPINHARGTFFDALVDWFSDTAPVNDKLDITITMDASELQADLDFGRND